MKVVKVWGGIGNQLFQYYFGQYLHHVTTNPIIYINSLGFPEIPNKLNVFLDLNIDQTLKHVNSKRFPFILMLYIG